MNYYQILQVSQQASQGEIKQAYRKLVKQFHPDSQHENANHEQIILINTAYEVLGDRQTRVRYDQELSEKSAQFLERRQQNTEVAQAYYQEQRQRSKQADAIEFTWLKDVYVPINQFISKILNPLDAEIETLSADPFDDQLMLVFQQYLETCGHYFEKAKLILMSQPNPSRYANLAANIYYCLNHIGDGIEELQRFTYTYDEYYLHTGKELFNIASSLNEEI
jgi:molecular chaperone DnaJ